MAGCTLALRQWPNALCVSSTAAGLNVSVLNVSVSACAFDQMLRISPIGQMRCTFDQMRLSAFDQMRLIIIIIIKSLKLSKEDALVHGKWRRLIRGSVKGSDDSGVNVFDCFWGLQSTRHTINSTRVSS